MKNIATIALGLLFLATSATAGPNNMVYIDQVGSSSVINLNQTGGGNELGNETTKAVFSGNAQTVMIQQIGYGNTTTVNIQGGGATVNSTATGDNNIVNLSCGAQPTTSCTDANLRADTTGAGNTLSITTGAKSTASIVTTGGDNNAATINNASDHLLGAKSSITIAGGQNTVSISQSGPAGASGFDAMVDVTGSSNNIGVTQTGTVDSKVNVKSVGSNNTITVRSGN
jgi:trimeric autotransporter adhesin